MKEFIRGKTPLPLFDERFSPIRQPYITRSLKPFVYTRLNPPVDQRLVAIGTGIGLAFGAVFYLVANHFARKVGTPLAAEQMSADVLKSNEYMDHFAYLSAKHKIGDEPDFDTALALSKMMVAAKTKKE